MKRRSATAFLPLCMIALMNFRQVGCRTWDQAGLHAGYVTTTGHGDLAKFLVADNEAFFGRFAPYFEQDCLRSRRPAGQTSRDDVVTHPAISFNDKKIRTTECSWVVTFADVRNNLETVGQTDFATLHRKRRVRLLRVVDCITRLQTPDAFFPAGQAPSAGTLLL